jgi:acyl transferase domain-containing protein
MADKIEPIAIVGMSCRFPSEAKNVDGLWDMMAKAKKGHSKIPADRFNADTWYHPSHDRRGAVSYLHIHLVDQQQDANQRQPGQHQTWLLPRGRCLPV